MTKVKMISEDIGSLDQIELHFLIAEINTFLDHLYIDLARALAMRLKNTRMDDNSAYAFFRSKDRLDNIKLLLQYLIFYTNDEDETSPTPIVERPKPFKQFKEAVRYLVDELVESDVQKAIFRDLIIITPIEKHSLTYFEDYICNYHSELSVSLDSADSPSRDNLRIIFKSLIDFTTFWFMLRQNNIEHIRKGDIFVFKLAKILYKKNAFGSVS